MAKNPWLPEPKAQCWVWFRPLGSETSGPRDAAALPHTSAAHEERRRNGLWGHQAYRLAPAVFVGDAEDMVVVKEMRDSKAQLKVRPGLVLDYYEGLLVLEALALSDAQCPWFEHVKDILEKEKLQRNLSPSLYVSKKLLTAAVTGPQFVTREGQVVAHRRAPLRADGPQEVEAPPGWYQVDRLLEYLPPWEAFVHPKCGLYQDYYLVQWAPPHAMDSYADTPQGCEQFPHATWEPDECLPDELDALRISAKKRWLEAQREKEKDGGNPRKFVRSVGEEVKADRKRLVEEVPAARKLAKVYNLDLHRHMKHGLREALHTELTEGDKHRIQTGWPKRQSEYPPSFGPAMPPGFCWDSCRCMEDWHTGPQTDEGKSWLDHVLRDQKLKAAIESFKTQQFLQVRGKVTNQGYFQPLTVAPRDPRQEERRLCQQASRRTEASSRERRT
ncbi:unnamed protein product [Effrenium voratum]|uniref:Uncharacterized protein n=1 Tax=Effrenium voratum TaxID=2562239 RepID=A0AA36HZZ5_9DINO|nr:unnamed protein product [Effrenium voratum]CAJ1422884.1 unnamed protein product [Effrenium voratum]